VEDEFYPLPEGEGRVRVSGFAKTCTLTQRFAPPSPRRERDLSKTWTFFG